MKLKLSDLAPIDLPRIAQLVIGMYGAVLAVIFVVHSRNADGKTALVASLVGAALSLVPAWGLVRAVRDRPLGKGRRWLAASLGLLFLLDKLARSL